jgi:hypothetical protein
VGWRSLITRWLLPNLLPLFPAVFIVLVLQGLLLVAASPDSNFALASVPGVIAAAIQYGIFLWVVGLVPAIFFLTLAPVIGQRVAPRWRPLATVGLAIAIGGGTLALLVALFTGGGFASHFLLIAPIWILFAMAVQVPAGGRLRRDLRAALAGTTIGALTLVLPFVGVGGLLWAGLMIGGGRRAEAGWVLAAAAVTPAILFASALALDQAPPLALGLASFSLAVLGAGIGLIILGGRNRTGDSASDPGPDDVEDGFARPTAG